MKRISFLSVLFTSTSALAHPESVTHVLTHPHHGSPIVVISIAAALVAGALLLSRSK